MDKEILITSMSGTYSVFAVTNYWEKMDAELEVKQGKNIVDVANEVGVSLLIWSSLYGIKKRTPVITF
jgi:NmrA-like family.